jgi:hypothetical protein
MNSKLLDYFKERRVIVICKVFFTSELGGDKVKKNMSFAGYIIDEDHDFIYLSNDGGEIIRAVSRDSIANIVDPELQEEMDYIDDIMNNTPDAGELN